MLIRDSGTRIRALLRRFPVVTILGPRQSGKTTFARTALRGWKYADLERPSDAAPFEADPEGRLAQLGDRVILDEAQRVPGIFPVLRSVIDRARRRNGRYVILGSAAASLTRGVSESLAGRTAFLDLPPLRLSETSRGRAAAADADGRRLWLRGGFPDAFLAADDARRQDWFEAYTRAFIERDLPALGVDISPRVMRTTWAMLAHCNGAQWNASQLAGSLGVTYHTVNRYVDLLEGAFLVRRLQPWASNGGKRLVKAPRVYFRDTGLLHHFLGIADAATLAVHPSRGASFEALVIDHVISATAPAHPGARFSYYRTAAGVEADLVVEAAGERLPFEIKLTTSPGADDAAPLRTVMRDLGAARGYLLHGGCETYSLGGGVTAIPAFGLIRSPRRVAGLFRQRG